MPAPGTRGANRLLLTLLVASSTAAASQSPFTVEELAQYRLTVSALERFERASAAIVAVGERDAAMAGRPLFTREVAVLDDAVEAATALEARLLHERPLADAVSAAKMSAREYTRFALALFAARLAHGFLKSGAMRRVPPGVAADNVAFIEAHDVRVGVLLARLGVEDP